jgi:uncharacterized membrane protein (DUF2068 family)
MKRRSARKRPFGVTAIVVLQAGSILALAVDIYKMQAVQSIFFLPEIENPRLVLPMGLAIILVELVIAFGLWHLKRFAWVLIMIQQGIGMAVYLWFYANGEPLYLSMLLSVIIVFYLNQREVQQAFQHRPRFQETA